MGIPFGFIFGQLVVCVCVCDVHFMLACSVSLLVFSWADAVMSLMMPILRLPGAVPRFFSLSLFIGCFVLVDYKIVELQSERSVFCM